MSDPLHQIIYVSAARKAFSEAQLRSLLADARTRNSSLGLTGLLLHERGSFLQVLEGDKQTIERVFAKIKNDARHHRIVLVYESSIEQRRFAEWSMGFASLSARDAQNLVGYDDFFVKYQDTSETPSASVAERILDAFRDGRWHAANE